MNSSKKIPYNERHTQQSINMTTLTHSDRQAPLTGEGRLSYDDVNQYYQEGYCILHNALTPSQLELLREGCAQAIALTDAAFDAIGKDEVGIDRRNSRYFPNHPSYHIPSIYDFIHSEIMVDAMRKLLGPDCWTFHEQYVVKMKACERSTFAWHQDSAYVQLPHDPGVTCWVALDEVREDNGPVRILPYSRHPESRELVPHEDVMNATGGYDKVGYTGPDKGDLITCPAGSIAFFSTRTLHCSGANTSGRIRRAYLIQYAKEIIGRGEGVLRHGLPVNERKPRADAPITWWARRKA